MKIAILGAGNMGTAFAKGLESHAKDHELTIVLTNHASENLSAIQNAEIIILAVKPKDISAVCQQISGHIQPDALVISIAAGVKIEQLTSDLSHSLIVRVMPNLLATIGESMSGWFAPSLNANQKKLVRLILSAIGKEVEVSSEDEIDKITAMSGSGPAYVWLFMESMIQSGVDLGLSLEQSKALTIQTFLGASKLAALGIDDVSTLRERVTSKGGTTERALAVFEDAHVREIFQKAVQSAYNKAKELGV